MIRLAPLAAYCRRMGIGLKAGLDVLKLFEVEAKTGDTKQKAAMGRVRDRLLKGHTLEEAMGAQGNYFPRLLLQMVGASELGGRMDGMFHYMADYYDQLRQTRSFFIGRISWPLIQLFLAVGIIGLVILLQGILSPNSTYDASSLGLKGLSGFITYCTVVVAVFGFIGLVSFGLWKNWFQCHNVVVPLVQRIPVLGTAFITLGLSRLSMTLSMLLNAGVDAKKSVRQSFMATGNHYFISGMDRAVERVDRGASFGEAFDASGVLPEDFVDMVKVGELSGTETESLDHLAEQYREKAKAALGTIATIASMVIWLGVIVLLAFMVIRMALQYINLINDFLP